MCLMHTDLPVPDGPRIIEIIPSGRPMFRPRRMRLRPKALWTSMNSIASGTPASRLRPVCQRYSSSSCWPSQWRACSSRLGGGSLVTRVGCSDSSSQVPRLRSSEASPAPCDSSGSVDAGSGRWCASGSCGSGRGDSRVSSSLRSSAMCCVSLRSVISPWRCPPLPGLRTRDCEQGGGHLPDHRDLGVRGQKGLGEDVVEGEHAEEGNHHGLVDRAADALSAAGGGHALVAADDG